MAEFDLNRAVIETDADLRVLSGSVHHQGILRQFAKEVWVQATKAALEAEGAWLDEAHGNGGPLTFYGERYLAGFKSAAGWVKFHAATPEAFRHLKEPDNG